MFNGMGPAIGKVLFVAFPGIMLGGPVAGILAGRWLGGLLADLRYSPTPGGAPAPKIHKGWVMAGSMLGCVIGAAAGMGITMVVMRHVQPRWLMPLLFFLPSVLFLVLGGFAGLEYARKRAAQRTSKRTRPEITQGTQAGLDDDSVPAS